MRCIIRARDCYCLEWTSPQTNLKRKRGKIILPVYYVLFWCRRLSERRTFSLFRFGFIARSLYDHHGAISLDAIIPRVVAHSIETKRIGFNPAIICARARLTCKQLMTTIMHNIRGITYMDEDGRSLRCYCKHAYKYYRCIKRIIILNMQWGVYGIDVTDHGCGAVRAVLLSLQRDLYSRK